MLTFKEIAKIVGTSPSSVSRVFNNSGYVSENKRKLIESALRENGYQVTSRRSAIPKSAEKIILVVVESLQNKPYIEYIEGINEYLHEKKFHTHIYISEHSPENEIQQIEYATSIGVGGIIMLSAVESEVLLKLITELSCPIVMLNRRLPAADVDSVMMDNFQVGYRATKYLVNHGHRNIIHLAGPITSTAANGRKLGYFHALMDSGIATDDKNVLIGDLSYAKSYELASDAINGTNPFSAVFAANDTMALGFIDGMYDAGKKCPDDISMICVENTLDTQTGKVKITSVGYDNVQMGRASAELLLNRLRDPSGRKTILSFMPSIIERESVADLNDSID